MAGGGALIPVAPIGEGRVGRTELVVRREGALKRLYTVARPASARAARDFVTRAQVALHVKHPSVVTPIELGEDRDGPFLWMVHAEGITPAAVIEDAEGAPVQVALRIATQVAEGAAVSLQLAPVVVPRWIVVGFDGMVRLGGLAVDAGEVGYTAPEVLGGGRPTERSELFALGVCLWELLAGRRLYPDTDVTSSRRITSEPTPDVALEREDVPDAIVQLLFELLAKDPRRRPSALAEVAHRLSDVQRQLAAEEGPEEIGPWLETRFGAERDRRRREIADAVVPLEMSGL